MFLTMLSNSVSDKVALYSTKSFSLFSFSNVGIKCNIACLLFPIRNCLARVSYCLLTQFSCKWEITLSKSNASNILSSLYNHVLNNLIA